MTTKLTNRARRLRQLETEMEEDMESFFRTGRNLAAIRDEKLYQEAGSGTFKEYLKHRWGYSEAHGYRLIEAAEVRQHLPKLKTHPRGESSQDSSQWTEKTVRELTRLKVEVPSQDGKTKKVVSPGMARKVGASVASAVKKGSKLTSGLVRQHVDKALGVKRTKPKPEPKPMFEEVIFRWTGRLNGMADVIDDVPNGALTKFGRDYPERAEAMAEAIERLQRSLTRVWERLP